MWIGCADSRVPANQVIGLHPGEFFVHRNIANVVVHTDLNCLSVIEYAVHALKVKHIIVCGHYGCGGVKAASETNHIGMIDCWLSHIREVQEKHADELNGIDDEDARFARMCELNVIEQVNNVARTTIVQQAWANGQELSINGWIYNLADGLIHNLSVSLQGPENVAAAFRLDVEKVV